MSNKMRVLTFPRYDFPNPRDDLQTVSSRIKFQLHKTAREFASTSNNCTANSPANLNSIKSTGRSLIKHNKSRSLNSSKPQQPGTFVIEHQKERSANLRRKFVIPYADVLGLPIDDRKLFWTRRKDSRNFTGKK